LIIVSVLAASIAVLFAWIEVSLGSAILFKESEISGGSASMRNENYVGCFSSSWNPWRFRALDHCQARVPSHTGSVISARSLAQLGASVSSSRTSETDEPFVALAKMATFGESEFSLDWSDFTDWWQENGKKGFLQDLLQVFAMHGLDHLMVETGESFLVSFSLWKLSRGV
jgi:hypothetical protein